ncbi:CPBP family intramembrane glutamic endopeptidase [Bifidobacterium primatium]|uniref:CPBP family intramembrane glutamic endopeptidase n=1 Tax=Bifidobacterium primatium TaxID=2045438 RepID=UPI0013FD16B4|nr:CPBP family intramembrane glutamic endopeptidase [Bifidobacterium primatium]
MAVAPAKPVRFFPAVNLRDARKAFNRVGWALFAFLIATGVAARIIGIIARQISPGITDSSGSAASLLLASLAQYGVGVPLCLLLFRLAPQYPPQPRPDEPDARPGIKRWLMLFLMGFPIMYGGSIIGQLVSNLLSMGKYSNVLDDLSGDAGGTTGAVDFAVQSLVVVILAPCFEELIFRKMLIDRLRIYGEKIAIFTSALLFCLMHTNTYQTFYTFGWGLIWAYIYTRTGRLRYNIALHSSANLVGGVIGPLILMNLDTSALDNVDWNDSQAAVEALARSAPALAVIGVYLLAIIGLAITGLVLLIAKRKEFFIKQSELELAPRNRVRVMLGNPGMIVFVTLTVLATFGAPVIAAFS